MTVAASPLRDQRGSPQARLVQPLAPSPVRRGQVTVRRITTATANILDLQGLSGNRSVQRLLAARQAVPTNAEGTPPQNSGEQLLSPAQEARALSFYRSQPAKYTPAIIGQIQAAVGTAATGAMTAEDTQAVARKQAELNVDASPALAVDGMAGPRTLPTVFKVGLAQDVPLTDYTTKAAAMWKDKSATEEETAKALVETVMNPRLATLGIPPLTFVLIPALGSRGAFSAADWELKLDTEQFKPGPRHDLKQTTSTIYHECRHAEQHFKVAQMLAGKKQNAVQINQRSSHQTRGRSGRRGQSARPRQYGGRHCRGVGREPEQRSRHRGPSAQQRGTGRCVHRSGKGTSGLRSRPFGGERCQEGRGRGALPEGGRGS